MSSLQISINDFEAAGGWERAFAWALTGYEDVIRLGHYGEEYPFGTFPKMIGAGAKKKVSCRLEDVVTARLQLEPGRWWLGYISYDAGRAFHSYLDRKLPRLDAGMAWEFINPEVLILEDGDSILIEAKEPAAAWLAIQSSPTSNTKDEQRSDDRGGLCHWLTQAQYIQKIDSIKSLLESGDLYELNFCRPVEVAGNQDMPSVFSRLALASPMPFQFCIRTNTLEMAGSSPERFLKRMEGRLISQPIKGTAARGGNAEEDQARIDHLQQDEKTLAENMMIADLVRNDLMRVCLPGTVKADEVFGVYTFRNLHQMITTISGQLPPGASLWQILAATFPMGSMTGAPKAAALGYIERHEVMARGPFSGAVGWVAPNGDFDFSVIIRSLYQNRRTGRCWLNTGGAIVWDSDPQAEFQEAELKASALLSVVRGGKGGA